MKSAGEPGKRMAGHSAGLRPEREEGVAGSYPERTDSTVESAIDLRRAAERLRQQSERIAELQEAHDTAELEVRKIHQVLKRGEATQDHGLMGNLACILDHVLSKEKSND